MASKRLRRDVKEIADLSSEDGVAIRVIPCDPKGEGDPFPDFQVTILSPECAPTANYIFFLDVKVPSDYPFMPPRIRVMNKIWHPKIWPRQMGGICMRELYSGWSPKLTLSLLLLSIRMLLGTPGEVSDTDTIPNRDAFNDYIYNQLVYNKKALEWAQEDNEGYGMVQFEDHKLSAVQSLLALSGFIPYECHVFCCRMSERCFQLTLIVIPSVHMYREKITPRGRSNKITQTEFNFESSAMSLTASEDSRDKCWKIKMSSSTFEKEKVDQFDPRKDPLPQCSVTIEWVRPERPPHNLIHKFYIKDCVDDAEIKAFDVSIYPESIPPTSGTKTSIPSLPLLLHLPVATNRHIDLAEEVGDNFDFGVHLLNDNNGTKTKNIRSQERTVKDINREILISWLQGQGKPVTWESLVSVLCSIQLNTLAKDIQNAVHIEEPDAVHEDNVPVVPYAIPVEESNPEESNTRQIELSMQSHLEEAGNCCICC